MIQYRNLPAIVAGVVAFLLSLPQAASAAVEAPWNLPALSAKPEDILRAGYERNTLQVAAAVDTMVKHRSSIDAIIMAPTYGAGVQFTKGLYDRKMHVARVAVSPRSDQEPQGIVDRVSVVVQSPSKVEWLVQLRVEKTHEYERLIRDQRFL